ncbi:MAG: hypothetical protein ABFQ64_10005 [Campylobacterota bacterium]
MKKMVTIILLVIFSTLTLHALDVEIKKGFTVTQIMLDIQNEQMRQEEIVQEQMRQELIRQEQMRQEEINSLTKNGVNTGA